MTINEAARRSGLSIDTIRYYEKEGLLPKVRRDARGWRDFGPTDLDWLITLRRLQATGMPMAEMTSFARSAHSADAETPDHQSMRRDLLKTHAARLAERRAELEACADYLAHKIAFYEGD